MMREGREIKTVKDVAAEKFISAFASISKGRASLRSRNGLTLSQPERPRSSRLTILTGSIPAQPPWFARSTFTEVLVLAPFARSMEVSSVGELARMSMQRARERFCDIFASNLRRWD